MLPEGRCEKNTRPNQDKTIILRQLVELIPPRPAAKLAREPGVDIQARSFTPWGHVVALLYAQLDHALSLNEVCDALKLWATPLRALRGATPPSRNNFSHANKTRDCAMAEVLFWSVLGHFLTPFLCFGGDAPKAWRTGSGTRFRWWKTPSSSSWPRG